ncbi:uncharacterized protein TA21185 [Theileria annulata]|uniref:Uncharacterized protein n=1 Tax=Theileria annulata TaxID=5874 RepID=Q4UGS0_THEAN|nr:uncharacterized protein TA21185 [Theileria annulata]CAI73719.1 hypothetical protein TA21185 [Theileria annulata]|eukprot:XP_954396.1 hypothetical protein TA21185 [Theileria annulata]
MGLTIYSQYEFDINNNIISQKLDICKYNRVNNTDEDKITNIMKDRKIKKCVKGNRNVKLHLILIKKYNSYLNNKLKTSRDLDTKQPSNTVIRGKNNSVSATELGNKVINGDVIKGNDANKYADDIMKTIQTKGVCKFDELFPKSRGKLVTSQYFLSLLVLLSDNKLQMTVINNEFKLSIAS